MPSAPSLPKCSTYVGPCNTFVMTVEDKVRLATAMHELGVEAFEDGDFKVSFRAKPLAAERFELEEPEDPDELLFMAGLGEAASR